MIGTIVIGSGNSRKIVARERNREFSKWCARAICEHVGIRPRFEQAANKNRKPA